MKTFHLKLSPNNTNYQLIEADKNVLLKEFYTDIFDTASARRVAANVVRGIYINEAVHVKLVDKTGLPLPCCGRCDSRNVERKHWLSERTGMAEDVSSDDEDNYCNDCEDHVELEFTVPSEEEKVIIYESK